MTTHRLQTAHAMAKHLRISWELQRIWNFTKLWNSLSQTRSINYTDRLPSELSAVGVNWHLATFVFIQFLSDSSLTACNPHDHNTSINYIIIIKEISYTQVKPNLICMTNSDSKCHKNIFLSHNHTKQQKTCLFSDKLADCSTLLDGELQSSLLLMIFSFMVCMQKMPIFATWTWR